MEHAKERAMIYTSAGEKTLKIKKDKFIYFMLQETSGWRKHNRICNL